MRGATIALASAALAGGDPRRWAWSRRGRGVQSLQVHADGADLVPAEPATLEPALRAARLAATRLAAELLGVRADAAEAAVGVTLRVTRYEAGNGVQVAEVDGAHEAAAMVVAPTEGAEVPEPAVVLYGTHRDLSCVTLVWQGGVPGLQVLSAEGSGAGGGGGASQQQQWVALNADAACVAVMGGTQGAERAGFRAAPHRVVRPSEAAARSRTTVVAFCRLCDGDGDVGGAAAADDDKNVAGGAAAAADG